MSLGILFGVVGDGGQASENPVRKSVQYCPTKNEARVMNRTSRYSTCRKDITIDRIIETTRIKMIRYTTRDSIRETNEDKYV